MPRGSLPFVGEVFQLMDDLRAIQDESVVRGEILRVIAGRGYDYFVVTRLPQPRLRLGPYMILKAWPGEWVSRYDGRTYYRDDPAVTRCLESMQPFDWSELALGRTLPERGALVMNEAAEHHLRNGYSVPIHDIDGFQAVVSMAGEQIDDDPYAKRALHLLSLIAFETAERLTGYKRRQHGTSLSKREREVLQFSAEGHSQDQIATRLGVSDYTIHSHLKNARTKLGALNTTHAVVRALRDRQIRL